MTAKTEAIANDSVVEQVARDFLHAGGTAMGAVLSGFFAAAGDHDGVLLGPVTVLVGGIGSGVRAFDGRLLQPGTGAKRPRGFRSDETIPDAARVAVPTATAAVLVAHAYDGGHNLGGVLRAGIRLARRRGAESRAAVLERIGSIGSTAFTESGFVRAMLRVAGPSQGGLLAPSDFAPASSVDHEAARRVVADGVLFTPPWAALGEPYDKSSDAGTGCALCAVDGRGVFAAVCYRRIQRGFPIDELQLRAPLLAIPVQRGVPRVRPGTRLAAPAPSAIRCDTAGRPIELIAAPAARQLDESSLAQATLRLTRDPESRCVTALRSDSCDA